VNVAGTFRIVDFVESGPADWVYLDRFVLSTGHSAIGLFATLGEAGLYSQDELHT
jgi:transketolase N-terminal domain/subunit